MVKSARDVQKVLEDVAKAEGIRAPQITTTFTGAKGDGYTSTITGYRMQGTNKKLDVVVKLAKVLPVEDPNLPLHLAYVNEIQFYTQVVPAFTKFQQEYNVTVPFDNTTAFFAASDEKDGELIVLDNLKVQNYHLWDRTRPMNKEHLEFVFRNYGKFHGTSYALKRIDPETYKRLTGNYESNLFLKFLKHPIFGEHQRKITFDLIDIFDKDTEQKYVEGVRKFAHNYDGPIADELGKDDGETCIIQGDCWCNNMMFQYEDPSDRRKPINMKMLDFQVISEGSPARDLAYFFYTIAPAECLERIEEFLKIYHDSMAAHVKLFGIDLAQDFPLSALMEHWRQYSPFGLIMSILVSKIMLTKSEDAPDFMEIPDQFDIVLDSSATSRYHDKMRSLFKHFIGRKYI